MNVLSLCRVNSSRLQANEFYCQRSESASYNPRDEIEFRREKTSEFGEQTSEKKNKKNRKRFRYCFDDDDSDNCTLFVAQRQRVKRTIKLETEKKIADWIAMHIAVNKYKKRKFHAKQQFYVMHHPNLLFSN